MSNPTGKGGFQDRKHQINRKGRPKTFDALRALAQQIAVEPAGEYTRVELILRSWSLSKNPQLQRQFIEVAYGKVPDVIVGDQNGGPVSLRIIYDKKEPNA